MNRIAIGGAVLAALALFGVWRVATAQEAAPAATYVGEAKCKKCHLKQYKTWAASKHSKNFETLPEDKRADPECVKCHVTGYGKPSGFVSLAETPNLVNTQCEACHGAGSVHIETAKANEGAAADSPAMAQIKATTRKNPGDACVGCHNPHVDHAEYKKG